MAGQLQEGSGGGHSFTSIVDRNLVGVRDDIAKEWGNFQVRLWNSEWRFLSSNFVY